MGKTHEERIAELELEIAQLRTEGEALQVNVRWLEWIAATSEKDPIYKKAMELRHKYRKAQRPGEWEPKER